MKNKIVALFGLLLGLVLPLNLAAQLQSEAECSTLAREIIAGRPVAASPITYLTNQTYALNRSADILAVVTYIESNPMYVPAELERNVVDVYYQIVRADLRRSPQAKQMYARLGMGARLAGFVTTEADYLAVKEAGWAIEGVALNDAIKGALSLRFDDYAIFEPLPRSTHDWPIELTHYVRWLSSKLQGLTPAQAFEFLQAENTAWADNISQLTQVRRIKSHIQQRLDTAYLTLRRQAVAPSETP